ncbi:MAG: hypothetical protein ACRDD1_17935, partial [Planctomycetia bacterium]
MESLQANRRPRRTSTLRWWGRLAVVALSAAPTTLLPNFASAEPADDAPIVLRESLFTIPVDVDAEKAEGLKELQLFVSVDKGDNWSLVKRAQPSQKNFKFKAQADGEYWFNLAYIDDRGVSTPPDIRQEPPAIKVVIDTESPVLTLDPMPGDSTRVGVQWQVTDARPDLKTLKLEVREGDDGDWRELKVKPAAEGVADWSARPGETYEVRGSVRDEANNVTTAKIEVSADGAPEKRP